MIAILYSAHHCFVFLTAVCLPSAASLSKPVPSLWRYFPCASTKASCTPLPSQLRVPKAGYSFCNTLCSVQSSLSREGKDPALDPASAMLGPRRAQRCGPRPLTHRPPAGTWGVPFTAVPPWERPPLFYSPWHRAGLPQQGSVPSSVTPLTTNAYKLHKQKK